MGLFYSGNNDKILNLIKEKNDIGEENELKNDSNVIAEFVLNKQDKNDFQMERGIQTDNIKTLSCKLCGSKNFGVGQAEFFTVIKCQVCGYEVGIHEG